MTSKLEPGLIQTFRIFLFIRFVGILVQIGRLRRTANLPRFRNVEAPDPLVAVRFFGLMVTLFLIIYLFAGPLQRVLGRFYLPFALGIDVFAQTALAALAVAVDRNFEIASVSASLWPILVNLFLVLVLTAWQYRIAGVIRLTVGILILDLLFSLPMIALGNTRPFLIITINVVRTIIFLLIGYMISRLVTAQHKQREALNAANRQLVHYASTVEELAISQERNRLARELHDTLAHSLSALAVHLEATHTLIDQNPIEAKVRLEKSIDVTRSGLVEARRAIHALRAEPLEAFGLPAALSRFAEEQARLADLTLSLDVSQRLPALDAAAETVIYNIGKEGITNVVRHANASALELTLRPENGHLRLEIKDNGSGFDPARLPQGHYGVQGMQERAAGMGARLLIQSRPTEGTIVRLEVPIQ